MKTARLGYFIKYHDGLNHVEPNKIGIESDFFVLSVFILVPLFHGVPLVYHWLVLATLMTTTW